MPVNHPSDRDAGVGTEDLRFLEGGGEMGALMRGLDWSRTTLGDPHGWPQALRTAVRLLLNTGHPMYIFWGDDAACLYNDPYRRLIGPERHPGSLGQPGAGVWAEIWDIIGPQIHQVMKGGPATWHVDQLVPITRHGRREDVYWTYSYGPIDDSEAPTGVGGVLVVCTETTASVESRQRQAFQIALEETLRGLSDPLDIMGAAAEELGRHLEVERCGYGEVDETGEFVTIWQDWTTGTMPSLAGRLRLDDFGPDVIDELREGRTVQLEDSAVDPRSRDWVAAYAAGGIRSAIAVPLVKDGRLVAAFYVHQSTARSWSEAHVLTVRSVAQRTWAAVERARAERALRENEARQALLLVLGDETRALQDDRQIMAIASRLVGEHLAADRAGCAEAVARGNALAVRADWSAGKGAAGPAELGAAAPLLLEAAGAGRALVVADTTDPPPGLAEACGALAAEQVGAALVCPTVRDGRLEGFIYVFCREPRSWSSAEVSLLSEVVGRTSAAVRRARAETASREAAEELRFALEAGRFGAWGLDSASGGLTASETFRECFGVGPDDRLTLADVAAAIHADDRQRVAKAIERTIARGAELDVEFRTVHEGETPRWLNLRGRAAEPVERVPRRIVGVVQDITRKRMAEARRQALIELSDRFRDADDTADLAYASAEIMGRALGVGRAGYGSIDPVAETITIERDWNAPGIRSLAGTLNLRDYGSFIDALKRGETVVIADAARDPRADAAALGAISAQSVVNMPVTEQGGLVALLYLTHARAREWSADELEFVRDVAERTRTAIERRRAEQELRDFMASLERQVERRTEELRASQARLRTIFETSFVYQGLMSLDGTLLAANATSLQGIQASLDDVIGRKFWDTPWFTGTPGMPEIVRQAVPAVASGHTLRREIRIKLPTGWRWFDFLMRPMRDEQGDIVAIIPEAVETTDRHKAEEQLRQVQKMEAIGNLTGGVAHDFNNLLQVVGGNLQLLEAQVGADERASRLLRNAMEGVVRGSTLVSQLLAFGRRQPLAPKVINLGRLVRGMEEMLRRALGEGIQIRTVVDGDLWNTRVDPSQVENALLNLAINARDAMDSSGRLTIEARNLAAGPEDEDLPEGEYVVLSVADTGVGMTQEVIEQAFEPFFTTKSDGRGTGLGLSMVYGFVKQSMGHVQLDSAPGSGTTIRLILPRVREAEERPAGGAAALGVGGSETVLVVEDDRPVRETAVEILSELGYIVLQAADGAEALAMLRHGTTIDLLFTDVVMPGPLRGPELAEQVRALQPDVGVLFTSGYVGHEVLKEGGLREGVDLLGKPYSRETLARKVRAVLQGRGRRPAAVPAVRPCVLLVEDEMLIAVATQSMIEDAGYEALATATAADALRILHEREVDVMVTDLGLPDMPGAELALRAVRDRPGIGIVIASGRDAVEDIRPYPELEGARLLQKPYGQAALATAIRQALEGRAAVR